MSFAVLPPEVNSARMFAGAGLGPMLAAATAWDGLAEELHAAASSFASVTAGLAGGAWQGPASVAMTRAADPYLGWLSTAASQAERAAGQARGAASAFEAALAATIPPALVAANRTVLATLVAANLLGQNAPAIAAAEAEYEQIWAQDVVAMWGYHTWASALATQLTPWQQSLTSLAGQLASAYTGAGLPTNVGILNIGAFNLGNENTGNYNIGFENTGNGNVGIGNTGNNNIGFLNVGSGNIGIGNTGFGMLGIGKPGDGNIGGIITANDLLAITNLYANLILADPESTLGQAATALILGGTSFSPLPEPEYIAEVEPLYLPGFPGFTPQFLVTPSKLFPFTGLDSLTFDTSVGLGAANLHAAIMTQYQAGYDTVVFATSQSATVATLVMRQLMSLPADMRPGPDDLFFTLTGNPNRPDGGFLSRFAGQYIKEIGFTFFGATPADAYPTTDYAIQYDAAADFPLYPLNFFATANAIAGFLFLHPLYTDLTPAQLAAGVVQPVSPQSLTTYILIPSEDLPLLYPLRAIPVLGDPLADLIQPNLRVLVELGYERTAYQDVPRPFGLFPDVDWATVAADLQQGAVQGVNDALAELGWPPPIPALPRFP